MQDPKTFKTRKPWYQRAIEISPLCKILFKPPPTTTTNNTSKTLTKTTKPPPKPPQPNNNNPPKLKKSTSLKVATSFTRVCLCAPISSYNNEILFNVDIAPPRRSYSYPRSKPYTPSLPQHVLAPDLRVHSARHSTEGRRIFRGKSLTDNVLMRRFVVEEEAMMQVRRRNQLEIIRKRAFIRRKLIGPSPLCRMVLAQDYQYV
ncbi:hypothetical protein RND81_05G128600 [Saponaria officinalis]|uniref:Uncharacterized protein n=1 Tax=Saponaria officinalis TaxID=3572 RepID=A0AAW1KXI4_SAPOF